MFFAWIFQSRRIERAQLREQRIANDIAALHDPAAAELLAQGRETYAQKQRRITAEIRANNARLRAKRGKS